MTSYNFYSIVAPVLEAGTWSNRGTTPKIKRFTFEDFEAMTEFGILLRHSDKESYLSTAGTVIYEKIRGTIYLRDTKEANLENAEADLKDILKAGISFDLVDTTYNEPMPNTYELQMEIEVTQ